VGCGGAVGALACRCGAAEVADDGEPRQRRSSGEGGRAEEGRRSNAAWWNGKRSREGLLGKL
jgi:hypothetical protein